MHSANSANWLKSKAVPLDFRGAKSAQSLTDFEVQEVCSTIAYKCAWED